MTDKNKVGFFKKLFSDLYLVSIKFKDGDRMDFELTEVKKITPNLLKGTTVDGQKIEYVCEQGFDYFIRKIY